VDHHLPGTPAEALAELLAGNDRFVTGGRVHPNQDAERRSAVAAAQRPFAVVFGCSDSRLAAEIIFDRGLGDLFVVRTAGHIIGAEVLASIEYGVSVLGAPLVVVLGHDSCGAIEAAQNTLAGGAEPVRELRAIVDRVLPSLTDTATAGAGLAGTGPPGGGGGRDAVADVHVRRTVEMLVDQHTAMTRAVRAGRCAVVGMSYRLADGRVTVITRAPAA
jgi:carbonic anhydrase